MAGKVVLRWFEGVSEEDGLEATMEWPDGPVDEATVNVWFREFTAAFVRALCEYGVVEWCCLLCGDDHETEECPDLPEA